MYSGGSGKDCKHGDFIYLMCPVQLGHFLATVSSAGSSQCTDLCVFIRVQSKKLKIMP